MVSVATDLYLPDECWVCIFKFLFNNNDHDNLRHCFMSLSLVSKQFLSITNSLRFSLSIYDPTQPFLSCLFHRFSNLISLNLNWYYGDLDALLTQISRFPLNLTSLNISNKYTIPAYGLRAFSQNITTLTSLTCPYLTILHTTDLFLIAHCFPLLEELNLSNPEEFHHHIDSSFLDGVEAISLSLFKLRKINLSGHYYINDQSLFHLINNCKFLQEVIVMSCHNITNACIASAYRKRPTLTLSYSTSEREYYEIVMYTTDVPNGDEESEVEEQEFE